MFKTLQPDSIFTIISDYTKAILRPVPEQRKKVFYWTWTGLGIEMNYLYVKL